MSEDILGYTKDGERIYPCEPGMIFTACPIICAGCHKVIRGMGGPMTGAVCLACWDNK